MIKFIFSKNRKKFYPLLKMKLDAHIVLTFHGPEDIDLVEIADTIKRKTGSNSHVVSIEKHNL